MSRPEYAIHQRTPWVSASIMGRPVQAISRTIFSGETAPVRIGRNCCDPSRFGEHCRVLLIRVAATALAAIFATAATAQYPSRPIKIVVAVAAGGAPDLAARVIGRKLGDVLGQPVIVDNRGGANGNVAGQIVAQSAPDGYTLLLAPDSLYVINPSLYKNLPFDPVKDLHPLATVIGNQFVLAVNPAVPARTFREFIEYAKGASPPLAYASAGSGSQHHLLMEMLKARAGIDLLHVPFKGGAPAVAATVAGETMVTLSGGPSTFPYIRAGKLRALAGSGTHRSEVFPELPSIGEIYPGYEGTVWSALFLPAGTPDAIALRLRVEVNKILAESEVKERFSNSGGTQPYITTSKEFEGIIRRDTEKYSRILADINLSLD